MIPPDKDPGSYKTDLKFHNRFKVISKYKFVRKSIHNLGAPPKNNVVPLKSTTYEKKLLLAHRIMKQNFEF